jgi:hypothetical protein
MEQRKPGRPRVVAPNEARWLDELRHAKKLSEEAGDRLFDTILDARRAGVTFRAVSEATGISMVTLKIWCRKAKEDAERY